MLRRRCSKGSRLLWRCPTSYLQARRPSFPYMVSCGQDLPTPCAIDVPTCSGSLTAWARRSLAKSRRADVAFRYRHVGGAQIDCDGSIPRLSGSPANACGLALRPNCHYFGVGVARYAFTVRDSAFPASRRRYVTPSVGRHGNPWPEGLCSLRIMRLIPVIYRRFSSALSSVPFFLSSMSAMAIETWEEPT